MTTLHWSIPAKSFVIGEYVALAGETAILMSHTPGFKFSLTEEPGLIGIHPDSPAGLLWHESNDLSNQGGRWDDPYQGLGGLGASSAQFIGVYRARMALSHRELERESLLESYCNITQPKTGVAPSGYDVLAQLQQGFVHINRKKGAYESFSWPFKDLATLFIHTQKKLATHLHLQSLSTRLDVAELLRLAKSALVGCEQGDSQRFIDMINAYHLALNQRGWVAPHTLSAIEEIRSLCPVLAAKGCGAMGADVILLVIERSAESNIAKTIRESGWMII